MLYCIVKCKIFYRFSCIHASLGNTIIGKGETDRMGGGSGIGGQKKYPFEFNMVDRRDNPYSVVSDRQIEIDR